LDKLGDHVFCFANEVAWNSPGEMFDSSVLSTNNPAVVQLSQNYHPIIHALVYAWRNKCLCQNFPEPFRFFSQDSEKNERKSGKYRKFSGCRGTKK